MTKPRCGSPTRFTGEPCKGLVSPYSTERCNNHLNPEEKAAQRAHQARQQADADARAADEQRRMDGVEAGLRHAAFEAWIGGKTRDAAILRLASAVTFEKRITGIYFEMLPMELAEHQCRSVLFSTYTGWHRRDRDVYAFLVPCRLYRGHDGGHFHDATGRGPEYWKDSEALPEPEDA